MEGIIEELSKKYNLPKVAIKEIIYSMFRFTASVIREGNLESVQLRYLGKFCVKPGKKKWVYNYRIAKQLVALKEKEFNESMENIITNS